MEAMSETLGLAFNARFWALFLKLMAEILKVVIWTFRDQANALMFHILICKTPQHVTNKLIPILRQNNLS